MRVVALGDDDVVTKDDGLDCAACDESGARRTYA